MKYRRILLCIPVIFLLGATTSISGQEQAGWRLPEAEKLQASEAARVVLGDSQPPVPAAVLPELRAQVIHASRRGPRSC